MLKMRKLYIVSLVALGVGACTTVPTQNAATTAPQPGPGIANPSNWKKGRDPMPKSAAVEQRVATLLATMSLEQKVGQIIQGDLSSLTPEEAARYHLGSVLNGGNGGPGGVENAPAPAWLAEADKFYDASVRPKGNLPIIPIIWGSDAVHGHGNVVGATLFPHNIGLGAMRNPMLMRKIGEVTAIEMRVTGLDWTFAPTLAVVRDDRWGRTYESFSENPEVVASYARPIVEGLQGRIGDRDWLKGVHIAATAKHFVGDGGTTNGKDQGDNASSEAELRDIQAAGYRPAIAAGVQSVMASYNSWQGVKMHGNQSLLTGVLKNRMGFGGFVVGDWNGHGQIPSCTPTNCAAAVNAGLDMYMAPDSWKALYENTLSQARSGAISMATLDEAVARILRVKIRSGLFEAGRPSSRPLAGDYSKLGSPEHRAIARQAVRESLVLLKNNNATLPLAPRSRILIAGDGANNLMKQAGGWTISWQGTGLTPADFQGSTSIGTALADAARAGGGQADISGTGDYTTKPDVAIVVFGEDPYAEFQGDVPNLVFRDTAKNLELLRRYQAAGIKTVSVFLSGRPLWVNPYINASDAFVAAWLPGSEGGGVADVLYGKADFKGKLSFSWPKRGNQFVLNVGDQNYDPLFPFGYGLSYARGRTLGPLDENDGLGGSAAAPAGIFFGKGKVPFGLSMVLNSDGARALVVTGPVETPNRALQTTAIDRAAQEDSRRAVWTGTAPATLAVKSEAAMDISREANGELSLEIDMKVDDAPTMPVILSQECGPGCIGNLDITSVLAANAGKNWVQISVPLSCFAKLGTNMARVSAPFQVSTSGQLTASFSRIALGSSNINKVACPL
jgi:beta-glucosidase